MTIERLIQLRRIVLSMERKRASKNKTLLALSKRHQTEYKPLERTEIEERYRKTLQTAEIYYNLLQFGDGRFYKFKEK